MTPKASSSPPGPRRRAQGEPEAAEPGSILTDFDLHLFNEGSHFRLYEKLGAHPRPWKGRAGTHFAVWAPNAEQVSVVGDFNDWDNSRHRLRPRDHTGIWEGWIEGIGPGALYKYHLQSRYGGYRVHKADPFGFRHEAPPRTGSLVWPLDYTWADEAWMAQRGRANALSAPISIYEVHLGSWRRSPEDPSRPLSYRRLAPLLADYVAEMGFTHVEFLPVMEHPFYGSWGYQTTGYFAPTARYGTPQDLMFLIDTLHQRGIGVILDWVPSHFPNDEHGLAFFDGTHLYEHADPRQGFHPDWRSHIFNYGRHETQSFLISSALFWLDRYHADALRVDAVASMLYLDYSRRPDQWIPNAYGGKENIEAIEFLRRFNVEVFAHHPETQTIAEESTAWPMVSRPTHLGGLGFGFKWDMGWMHDTLQYMSRDPVHRKYHHDELTFRQLYAHAENFILPLSHDEVVYGKGALLARMPGDSWRKFANLRLLLGYMFGQSGKKLLFMGAEFGQWTEWDHERELDWALLAWPLHQGLRLWVGDLNRLYRTEHALHELDAEGRGFEWISCHDADQSVLSLLRRGRDGGDLILGVFNFTPIPRHAYRVGVPRLGRWAERLNSDAPCYGGSGQGNLGGVEAEPAPHDGRPYRLTLTLPPLAALFFKSPGA